MRTRRHLSYANVAATLALVIAIAGGTTAMAGSKIGAQDLKKVRVRQAEGETVATARCQPRERLLGGGGTGTDFGGSRPEGNGWVAGAGIGQHVTAYALCLSR